MCSGRKGHICRVVGAVFPVVLLVFFCASCGTSGRGNRADMLNDEAYRNHYISLETTSRYAREALSASGSYEAGRMEALNHLVFTELMKMDYSAAETRLKQILNTTDNQIELLVANVQMMRLCQRMSRNKEFYVYLRAAEKNAGRIRESRSELTARQVRRLVYAETEMNIVRSAYLYYIGQMDEFRRVLGSVDMSGVAANDTAQVLNLLYNIGDGGFYVLGSGEERSEKEFAALTRCYLKALRAGQIYWQANALQAMSEHLIDSVSARRLTAKNALYVRIINDKDVPDSLLALTLARRSLRLFRTYGDTYQTAGAMRTVADCLFALGRYDEAITSLERSLSFSRRVEQSPALASSIYERLSICYSALDNKPVSDYYRNLYLDTQENTRQDRELDVRAEQLNKMSKQLNLILLILLAAVVILIATLYISMKKRKEDDGKAILQQLFAPLRLWREREQSAAEEAARRREDIAERSRVAALTREHNLQVNIEQRAKVSLFSGITPLISRMITEINLLKTRDYSAGERERRRAYIAELNDKIVEYNDVLTRWIQLRKGELSLRIESFPLQQLFDMLSKSAPTFDMQGVRLTVKPTAAVVKADRALTLFMLNTIADNARKATPNGGEVVVSAEETEHYVELSVADTGRGMNEKEMQRLFGKCVPELPEAISGTTGGKSGQVIEHGFGLMNCKGIIEKYKKTSRLFSVCQLGAQSRRGIGTTVWFRLPRGIIRRLVVLTLFVTGLLPIQATDTRALERGRNFADSTYFCNLQGRYSDALSFAKAALSELNNYYKSVYPESGDTLVFSGGGKPAELDWTDDTLAIDFGVVLDIRNEAAVAALALHDWDAYSYNNKVYTRLFKELSRDKTLSDYVTRMQSAGETKNVAIILLILLLAGIIAVYYFLYYRRERLRRTVTERAGEINAALLDASDPAGMLEKIRAIGAKRKQQPGFTHDDRHILGRLDNITEQITHTLERAESERRRGGEDMLRALDTLHIAEYESECLHVGNNVLDNCLSALKHETMYYPSRISSLLSAADPDAGKLEEVARYYEALFTLLVRQAQNEVKKPLRPDKRLMEYLKTLLLALFDCARPRVTTSETADGEYDLITLDYPDVALVRSQAAALFMPLTENKKCLIARQIVREAGESTGKRGCGIYATALHEGGVRIVVTLAKRIKFAELIKE